MLAPALEADVLAELAFVAVFLSFAGGAEALAFAFVTAAVEEAEVGFALVAAAEVLTEAEVLAFTLVAAAAVVAFAEVCLAGAGFFAVLFPFEAGFAGAAEPSPASKTMAARKVVERILV